MVEVKRNRSRDKEAVQEHDEVVTVHTGVYGVEQSKRTVLRVRKFLSEPAYARVSHGITKNMGNYESLRLDVSVSIPCYAEEIEEALPVASDIASVFLNEELDRMGIK